MAKTGQRGEAKGRSPSPVKWAPLSPAEGQTAPSPPPGPLITSSGKVTILYNGKMETPAVCLLARGETETALVGDSACVTE